MEIEQFGSPELDVYARCNEVQLLRYEEPGEGLFIAESPMVIERAIAAGYEPVSFLVEKRCLEGEGRAIVEPWPETPIFVAELSVLTQLTGYQITRGILCAMRRRPLPTVEQICTASRRLVIMEDVENPTNVGAMFRSAAALGMDGVLLTEGSADPLYRRACRVSMGTVFQVPWTKFHRGNPWMREENGTRVSSGIACLHRLGYQLVAMALTEDSISIRSPELRKAEKLAIVMGTEGAGLRPETIRDCDYVVKIPMTNGVDSLNVAAASALACWELGNLADRGGNPVE